MRKILISLLALFSCASQAHADACSDALVKAKVFSSASAQAACAIFPNLAGNNAFAGNVTIGGTLGVTGVSTFTTDVVMAGSNGIIRSNTTAGADNKQIYISPSTSVTIADAPIARLLGNEVASIGGSMILSTGDVSTADMFLASKDDFIFETEAGADLWVIDANITQNPTNGGNIIQAKAATGVIGGAASIDADVSGQVGTPSYYSLRDTAAHYNAAVVGNTATAVGPFITAFKTRSASGADANTIVASGDDILSLQGYGADGVDYIKAARILFEVDGTPGVGDMPGAIDFLVTPDGSGTPASAMRISNNKGIVITGTFASSATSDLGWSVQAAANQACNTTCSTACVFGQETTSKAILACTDATADSCLCAGLS